MEENETRLEERAALAFFGTRRALRGMQCSEASGGSIGGTCFELVVISEEPARED